MADPVPVPAKVETAARSADLGELHGVYTGPSNTLYVLLWWAYGGIVLAIGIAALNPGAGVEGNGSTGSKTITILIGVVVTLGGAAMLWRGIQIIRNRRLYLYTRGIVYTHPSGKAKWYGTWQDVQVFWGQGNTRNAEAYRIVFPQGGKVRWGVMTATRTAKILTEGVGAQARKLSAQHKLPILLTRMRSGEILEFGPLHLDSKGVVSRNQNLAWRDIKGVRILGRISLTLFATNNRAVSARLMKIPDLSVLLRLIEIGRNS